MNKLKVKNISNKFIFLEDENNKITRVYYGGLSKTRILDLLGSIR